MIGAATKGERRWAQLGCAASRSRGDAICNNRRTISEKKITGALVNALRRELTSPELVDRFVSAFEAHYQRISATTDDGTAEPAVRVREAERRVSNLADAVASAGWSEALGERLRAEEAVLASARSALAAAQARRSRPRNQPPRERIRTYLGDLLPRVLAADPARAREILTRFLSPITLTPGVGRSVEAASAIRLSQAGNELSSSSQVCEKYLDACAT